MQVHKAQIFSLEQQKKRRANGNAQHGTPEGWGDEALDAYLDGMRVTDIALVFDISKSCVSNAIARAALIRLMEQRKAEQLTEIEELLPKGGS